MEYFDPDLMWSLLGVVMALFTGFISNVLTISLGLIFLGWLVYRAKA